MKVLNMARKFVRLVFHRGIRLKDIGKLLGGFLRGACIIAWYRMTRRNVHIRFPFMVYAPVKITGKGSVFIDEGCSVFYSVHQGLNIATLSKDATVSIGRGCDLGGLTIRCRHAVTLGERVMTAVCLVQDSLLVHGELYTAGTAARVEGGERAGIVIGDHVWLSSMSTVLGGTILGSDSVLSVGACAAGEKTNDYVFLSGNPLGRVVKIESLLRLKGRP